MRLGVAILLLVAVVVAVLYGAFVAGRWLWRRQRPWGLVEEADGQNVKLYAFRADAPRLLVQSLDFGAEDFDSLIYEARAQAKAKVYALNAGRRK
jgi:hypothetical protein